MPHISTLTVASVDGQPTAGFRSLLGRYSLPPCLLLAGANGVGKTAHLNLVEAAVQGLTTSRAVGGKTAAKDAGKPRRIYLGDDLFPGAEVRVELSTGQSFTRPLDTANENAGSVKAADVDARRLVGQPSVPWTAMDFLHSSDLSREQLFAAAAQAGGKIEAWDTARAMTEARSVLMDTRPEDIDEDTWAAHFDKLCATYTEAEGGGGHWLVLVSAPAEEHRLRAGRAKDAAAVAHKRAKASAAKRPASNRAAAAARRSAALVRQQQATQAQAIAARYEAQKAAHQAEVDRLTRSLADIVTNGRALRTELEAAKAAPAPAAEDFPADVRAELEAASADLDAPVPVPDGSAIPAMEREVAEKQTALDLATDAMHAADRTADAATAAKVKAVDTQKAAADKANRVDMAILEARATVAAMLSSAGQDATCAHCGAADPLGHGAKLDAARTAMESAERAADEAARALHAANADADVADDELSDATEAQDTAHRVYGDARTALLVAQGRLASARDALSTHDARVKAQRAARMERAQGAVQRENERIAAALSRAMAARDRRITDAQAAVNALLGSHKATSDALAQAKASPPVPPGESVDTSDVPEILSETAAVEAEWVAFDLAEAQAASSAAEALSASVAHTVAEATVRAIRAARERLASSVYAPVEAHMRSIMARCGDQLPVPYFRGPTKIGATRPGGVDVDLASLSASEQLITLTALTCAMSRIAGLPMVIAMIDELGKVQADHRVPLLRGLREAVAHGEIDQLLVTMPTAEDDDEAAAEIAPYREIPGLEVRRLTRHAPVVASIGADAAESLPTVSTGTPVAGELPF